jgi:hypothetical protein
LSLNRIQSQNRFPMAGYSSHNRLNRLMRRSYHLNLKLYHRIQMCLLIRRFLRWIQSQNRNRFPMAGYSSHNRLNRLMRRSRCLNLSYFLNLMSSLTRNPKPSG